MARGVHTKGHWSEQRMFDQRAIAAGALNVLLTLDLLGCLFLPGTAQVSSGAAAPIACKVLDS